MRSRSSLPSGSRYTLNGTLSLTGTDASMLMAS
jgi:hypothetical protein